MGLSRLSLGRLLKVVFWCTLSPSFSHASLPANALQLQDRSVSKPGLDVLQKDFENPLCFKNKNKDEKATFEFETITSLYQRSFIEDPLHPESLWDQEYLAKNPHITKAIQEFRHGKRGQSIKSIRLTGKTAFEIHNSLEKNGFLWRMIPLRASLKRQTYWLNNGDTTKDKSHPDVIHMYVYIHSDGGIVRVKPKGIPDLNARHPRRSAHATKAVLTDINPDLCSADECNYDISYQNEAFKVSDDNQPLPKAPSPKYGLKLPSKDKSAVQRRVNRLIANTVMNLAHTNIKTSCVNAVPDI